jgi:hypothetical protein
MLDEEVQSQNSRFHDNLSFKRSISLASNTRSIAKDLKNKSFKKEKSKFDVNSVKLSTVSSQKDGFTHKEILDLQMEIQQRQ